MPTDDFTISEEQEFASCLRLHVRPPRGPPQPPFSRAAARAMASSKQLIYVNQLGPQRLVQHRPELRTSGSIPCGQGRVLAERVRVGGIRPAET
jgi:hypothetical protein